jgi:hypothetical protein
MRRAIGLPLLSFCAPAMLSRLLLLASPLLLSTVACSNTSQPNLETGTWTGTLTPMNHPEMANPVTYAVDYPDGTLSIDLIGPGGASLPTRSIHYTADSLHYAFDEPEEGVTLRCALGRQPNDGFAGRCTDANGQWAHFTMVPPTD